MKILVIGGGGREHAMAWKLAESSLVSQVLVAPGNAGTAHGSKLSNVVLDLDNFDALIDFVRVQAIKMTVVGPEAPLAAGIVDAFKNANLLCLGPSKAAAQLEASKAFCKDFMKQYQIPTAKYAVFNQKNAAKDYLATQNFPIVLKADGLAGGKGVIIANNQNEALSAVATLLTDGKKLVIEEFIQGEEASFIVLTDGKHILPLASAQDHKTRDNGDKGPNTGGMGAYSPAPIVTPQLSQLVLETIIQPTIEGMAQEGHPYVGFLFAGLMIDKNNHPKVLEFNCRLGDPETQVILPRLKTDFAELCLATLSGTLDQINMEWDERSALGVVLAASGYPEKVRTGDEIQLPHHLSENQLLFHAGTATDGNKIITKGGRVLCAVGLDKNLSKAKHTAYELISSIHYDGMFYRTDIGDKALD
ncbi:MAG: phosphoribosylamine--glycine ligase [Gammaproteobacteria bacterium]